MSKKALSAVWLEGGAALWHQPTGQTTLALCARIAIRPTATSSDGYGSNAGLWRATPSAIAGRPKWLQPADASSNHCALVAPATSPGGRVLGGPPSDPRWHLSGSPERRLCMDAARFAVVYAPRNGGEPCAFAAVLHHAGPPRVNALQSTVDGNLHAPDLAPSVADDRHSTLSGPTNGKASVGVASRPNVQTPGNCAPCFATSWRSAPMAFAGSVHRSGAGLGGTVRAAPGTPGRTRARFQRSQTCPEYVARRLAKHVSLSRRSRDPEIHQRLRGIFPLKHKYPTNRNAYLQWYVTLPSIKTNSFWHLFPFRA